MSRLNLSVKLIFDDIIHSEQDRETMIKQLKDIGLKNIYERIQRTLSEPETDLETVKK